MQLFRFRPGNFDVKSVSRSDRLIMESVVEISMKAESPIIMSLRN